jgi:probable F420-dependent oxidoreductase
MRFTADVPGLDLYPGIGRHWWEHATPEDIAQAAQGMERAGVDFLYVSEHVLMSRKAAPEMGPRWAHSMSSIGFLAGVTKTIELVCLVVLPYHNPLDLAKSLATLDFLSGGRLVLLALVGYNRWEFEQLGVPFAERGARTDDYLDAMTALWRGDPDFHGRFINVQDVVFDPKPTRNPIPIWHGGFSNSAVRRVARIGEGWITYATPRAQLPEALDHLRSQPDYAQNPRRIELSLPLFEGRRDPVSHAVIEQPRIVLEKEPILEEIRTIAALGATITDASTLLGTGVFQNDLPGSPPPTRSLGDYLERVQWFAEEILPEARTITGNGI